MSRAVVSVTQRLGVLVVVLFVATLFVATRTVRADTGDPESKGTACEVEAAIRWRSDVWATVRIDTPGVVGKRLPVFRFSIDERRVDASRETLFSMSTSDHVVALFPLGGSAGPIIAIWEGGTGYHIRGYIYADGKVSEAIDTWSKYWPETIDSPDGHIALVVAGHTFLGDVMTPGPTQPANPGEVWTYGDPQNNTRAKVEMSGLEVVSCSSTGIVDRYYGRSSAVHPGMSKEAVIAELGEPTRVTIVRDEKREYYTIPNTYGLNEMRAVGFDSSGKVTEAYRSSMYD